MAVLIKGGRVLRVAERRIEPADVLVRDDTIVAVGRLDAVENAETIDATGTIVMPGLVNAHTHSHGALARGTGDAWTLELLLNYQAPLNANRTPHDHYVAALLNGIEMLESGCTACYDLFVNFPAPTLESIDAVLRAYAELGIRAVVAPAVADLPFYSIVPGLEESLPPELRATLTSRRPAPGSVILEALDAAIRRWDRARGDRIRLAVAPTIPAQCSDAFLAGCGRLARDRGTGFHTHTAESKTQAIYAGQRYGTTIPGHLYRLGLLGRETVLAHSIWLTDEDVRRIADSGAIIAHNPASNLKLGNGIAPVRDLLEAGVTVALGTDSSGCSDNQNVFEALRFAALVSRARDVDIQRWVTAAEALAMATGGGARALGLGEDLGDVVPGQKADLVLLDAGSIYLTPLNDVIGQLVFAENGQGVRTVLVDGRTVVRDGRVLTVDKEWVQREARAAAERLWISNGAEWELARRVATHTAAVCSALVTQSLPGYLAAFPAVRGEASTTTVDRVTP
ncbi:MAG: amidohydrolase [Chloroflexi bacterium]|nr:amidohydrolase [Chloroflexota bacterium]